MVACLSCGKYIFDGQNVNKHKRMTATEYVDGVYRHTVRTNEPSEKIISDLGLKNFFLVNKSECELCGAPHAVFSDKTGKVVVVKFFFSSTDVPSEKDVQFINHFKREFFAR